MPTAEQLLADSSSTDSASQENHCIVSEDLRTVTVPESQKILGVTSDQDVRKVWFDMPAECDGTDLSDYMIFVKYRNAANVSNRYRVGSRTVHDGVITFYWLVSRGACAQAGTVNFSVCLRAYEEDGITVTNEFNTIPAEMEVKQGLDNDDEIEVTYRDEVNAALNELLDDRHIMTFMGEVESELELPDEGNRLGDMYSVILSERNYYWNGTDWLDLGGDFAYQNLPDKPSINNVTLVGNKSLTDLGFGIVSDARIQSLFA